MLMTVHMRTSFGLTLTLTHCSVSNGLVFDRGPICHIIIIINDYFHYKLFVHFPLQFRVNHWISVRMTVIVPDLMSVHATVDSKD